MTYLGHVVSESDISYDPAKIEAVENWPTTPVNESEVGSILGLIGYYRKFVVNFSTWANCNHIQETPVTLKKKS